MIRLVFGLLWASAALFFQPFVFAKSHKKDIVVADVFRFEQTYNIAPVLVDQGVQVAKTLFEEENPNVRIQLPRYSHDPSLASVLRAADAIIRDHRVAVIGGGYSDDAIVLADRFQQAGVLLVSPTASHPRVTENHPLVFRICFADQDITARLAHYVAEVLRPKKLASIHNVSSSYSDFLTRSFISEYEKLIPHLSPDSSVLSEKVLKETRDYTDIIQKFQRQKVSHVLLFSIPADMIEFVAQAGNANYFPIYIGSDGWGLNEIIYQQLVLDSPYGKHFIGYRAMYYRDDISTPLKTKFEKAFRKKYKQKPEAWNAIGFDSAWILFTAMNRAKDPNNVQEIKAELEKIKNMALATSKNFSFGPDHNPNRELYIFKIDSSGIHEEATL